MTRSPESAKSPPTKIVLGVIITAVFIWSFAVLAGRSDWIRGWAYVALLTCGQSLSSLYVWRKDPEVLRRRARIGKGTKTWDKLVLSLFAVAYLAVLVVAALDERYGWSAMSGWFWLLGAALYMFCAFMLAWAMSVNTYFEKTVRIQHDRAHKVIDSGPYRIVRHPGYLGTIFGFGLAGPLLLGSWWAFVPAAIAVASLVVRTALEDRMLKEELDGYESYAQTVRHRLLPGFW